MDIRELLIFSILTVLIILFAATTIFSFKQDVNITYSAEPKIVFTDIVPDTQTIKITASPNPDQGSYEYGVSIPIVVQYSGTLTHDLNVIPIISFKGEDVRAKVNADRGQGQNIFVLSKDSGFSGTLSASSIASYIPPSILVNAGKTNQIRVTGKEILNSQSMAFQSYISPNITVTLVELRRPYLYLIAGEIPKCRAFLTLECADRLTYADLYGSSVCDKTGDRSNCDATTTLCQTDVILSVESTDCSNNKAVIDFTASYTGGEENLTKYNMQAGEDVGVSFWDSNQEACIDQQQNVQDMLANCRSAYLGGPYKFKGPIVQSA